MITVTDTPNPESKKFVFDIDIVASGSKEIKSIKECSDIKFAERIFASGLSELIYIDTNFVTIKKTAGKNWDEIKQDILNILLRRLAQILNLFLLLRPLILKMKFPKE